MKYKIAFIILMASLLFYLYFSRVYNFYSYDTVSKDIIGGAELVVILEGTYSENYEKDGRKMADWSFPYYLEIYVHVPDNKKFCKLVIENIKLIGQKTGKQHVFSNVETDEIRDLSEFPGTDEEGRNAIIIIGPIDKDNYAYEDYLLTAKIKIYLTSEIFEEENVQILLKTDYYKRWRSDWFDEFMSV